METSIVTNPTIKNNPWQISTLRQVLAFSIGWLGLNVIALVVSLLIGFAVGQIYPDPVQADLVLSGLWNSAAVNIVSYVFLLLILTLLIFGLIKRNRDNFSSLSVIFKGVGYGALILASGIALNLLYLLLKIDLSDNANQSTITEIMKAYPFWSFIAFVIAGPVCEEITYRLGLFSLGKRVSRLFAYALTLVFFGLIHFDFQTTNLVNELLNLPYYMLAGFLFCFIYEQEGLSVSIYAHITNNLVSFIFSLFFQNLLMRII